MSRAGLDREPREVAGMFDTVAPRYDAANTVMSLGQERVWRRAAVRALGASRGDRVLDLATGTGTSAAAFAARGAEVVGCDFSLGMLRAGADRRGGASAGGVRLVAGDALALPFADSSFDAVTISFGLRNVADVDRCLTELWRVTRPGGRLLVCETSHPPLAPLRLAYRRGLLAALTAAGRVLATNPEAYSYLAESMRAWPDQAEVARRLLAAGWRGVSWRNLTAGAVALHRAHRP